MVDRGVKIAQVNMKLEHQDSQSSLHSRDSGRSAPQQQKSFSQRPLYSSRWVYDSKSLLGESKNMNEFIKNRNESISKLKKDKNMARTIIQQRSVRYSLTRKISNSSEVRYQTSEERELQKCTFSPSLAQSYKVNKSLVCKSCQKWRKKWKCETKNSSRNSSINEDFKNRIPNWILQLSSHSHNRFSIPSHRQVACFTLTNTNGSSRHDSLVSVDNSSKKLQVQRNSFANVDQDKKCKEKLDFYTSHTFLILRWIKT